MHHPRTLLLVLAAAVLAPAAAAGASTPPIVAGGSFVQTVPFIDGTLYAFECHAAAAGASTTTIGSCALTDGTQSIAAPPASSTGPAAATDEAVAVSPLGQWRVCWTASAQYPDDTSRTTSGCSSTSSLAGTGTSTG